MKRKVYLLLLLRRWHGRFGITAAIFFLFLATTGVALNHTAQFRLDAYRIHALWLTRWYGLKVEQPAQEFAENGALLIGANGAWLLNDKVIAENVLQPLGMVESEGMRYIATQESLYIYTTDGRFVEKVSGSSLPALPVLGIGATRSHLVLQTPSGVYASADAVDWKAASPRGVRWSRGMLIPSSEQARIAARLAPGISAQTLMRDVHSGRIFGTYGAVVMDIVALILVVLCVSGVIVFFRSHRHHGESRRAGINANVGR